MTMMLRILFGAETVSSKLTTACFHVDSWFTGADFPHAALACIRSAVRRRKLVFYLYFVLLNVCVRMWGSMFLLFVLCQVTKYYFFMGSTTTRYGKEPEFIPGGACDVSRASRRLLEKQLGRHTRKIVLVSLMVQLRFVRQNFKDRCIFKDITTFVSDPSVPLAKMKCASRVQAIFHKVFIFFIH